MLEGSTGGKRKGRVSVVQGGWSQAFILSRKEMEGGGAERDGGAAQALPVEDCGMSRAELQARMADGVEPESAAELLARVRLENEATPQFVTVEHDVLERIKEEIAARDKRQQGSGAASASAESQSAGGYAVWDEAKLLEEPFQTSAQGSAPSGAWRKSTMVDFMNLRQYICRWEDRLAETPQLLSTGSASHPPAKDKQAWEEFMQESAPRVSTLINIEQKVAYKVIKDSIDRLQESEALDEKLTLHLLAWIYALLARIEKPLGVGLEAQLRVLLRALYPNRNSSNERQVDVVVCILEDYFRV